MDVDGKAARRVLKHVERIPETYEILGKTYTHYRLGIKAPYIASLMGEAAWLVTENKDFEKVLFEDDEIWYEVIYGGESA